MNADMFRNYDESFKRFVSNDQGFLFRFHVYCKKIQERVLVMIKQLDCPTFLKLFYADLRWNELVEIIPKLNS